MKASLPSLPTEVQQTILLFVSEDLLPTGPSGASQTAFQIEREVERSRQDAIACFTAIVFMARSTVESATHPLQVLRATMLHRRDDLQAQLRRLVSDAADEGNLEMHETGTIAEEFDEFDELIWANNDLLIIDTVVDKVRRVKEAQRALTGDNAKIDKAVTGTP